MFDERFKKTQEEISGKKLVLDKKRLDLAGVVRDFIVEKNSGKKFLKVNTTNINLKLTKLLLILKKQRKIFVMP